VPDELPVLLANAPVLQTGTENSSVPAQLPRAILKLAHRDGPEAGVSEPALGLAFAPLVSEVASVEAIAWGVGTVQAQREEQKTGLEWTGYLTRRCSVFFSS
jgi:hypothetical protein